MIERSNFRSGERVLWRGTVCEIFAVRVHDRETPDEHIEYDAETLDGEIVRIREDEVVSVQQSFF
jgi:hypothetical protein